jgi:protein SCO1
MTPTGKISRYFLGIEYPPTELRQAIVDAGADRVGVPAERVFLYCFHYDPTTGKYGLIIDRAIRAAGVATLLALGTLIGVLVMRERRRMRIVTPSAGGGVSHGI